LQGGGLMEEREGGKGSKGGGLLRKKGGSTWVEGEKKMSYPFSICRTARAGKSMQRTRERG